MKYRADIDGLRALAVLPVVLFHAGFSGFQGGFVGVDVFFVISGYLITTILADEITNGTYSIAGFYERRIRRIFPAFAAMIAVTTVVAVWVMLPDDLDSFGGSVLSSSLFSSNIFFWVEAGNYFDGPAEVKPLLHTWSLSVEEQFYIFFPIFLALLNRFRLFGYAGLLCLVAFAGSFALSVWGTANTPVATFYLLPTRAWELLAGSLLALGLLRAPRSQLQAELEAAAGALLILVPVFVYTPDTVFPGLAALPPVLGATLVIHAGMAGRSSLVSQILALNVLRFVGLISYSLYLWHWPIIVLARYYFIEDYAWLKYAVLALSFVAAVLSWRFVERPFRGRTPVFSTGRLFAGTAAALALFCAIGLAFHVTAGLPGRVPDAIRLMADKATYHGPGRECGNVYGKRQPLDKLCVLGRDGASPDFLVVGDSHANAIAPAIFEAAAEAGRAGFQLSDNGYRPLPGYLKVGEPEKYAYLNKMVVRLLDSHPHVVDIIVPIYWRQAALTDRYMNEAGHVVPGVQAVREGLTRLIKRYPDRRFLLIESTANSPLFGGAVAARAAWYGRSFDPVVNWNDFQEAASAYQGAVAALKALPNAQLLDLSSRVCDGKICHGFLDGKPAFADDNHIAYSTARLFTGDFRAFLSERTAEPMAPAAAVSRSPFATSEASTSEASQGAGEGLDRQDGESH